MRLFVAVEPSEEVVRHLQSLQTCIRAADISLCRSFHLTLKFLGEVHDASGIIAALDRVTWRGFCCKLWKIGFFPNERQPRVLWVGLEPQDRLMALHKKIDAALGLQDRRFYPHLTLGRVRHIQDRDEFCASASALRVEPLELKVERFHLIESVLKPTGAVHQVMKTFINAG